MNIIDGILKKRESRILASEQKMDEAIFAVMESKGYERDNDIATLLYESSGYGQELSFHAGFQTAVSL